MTSRLEEIEARLNAEMKEPWDVEANLDFIEHSRTDIRDLLAVVKAGKSVIDFLNPMFCDHDECIKHLRDALAALEGKDEK